MAPTTPLTQRPTLANDFGLGAIAQHNAAVVKQGSSIHQGGVTGLGIYQHGFYQDEPSYTHNPPTPRSTTETEGVRTRSGRSARLTDSPFSTTKSRVSKSPASRSKKEKKSKVMANAKTPKLTAPLSVLTKDMDIPLRDIEAWVHRTAGVRREEVEKRHGYVTRPMNSFMLYRSAYAERTKQWATQNNHQVVSSIAGESWPMEPEEVRNQFNEWAKLERANHAAAHPEYKFSPSKVTKKRKGDFSDDEDDVVSDLDADPDGEYRVAGRSARQRRPRQADGTVTLNSTVGIDSNPYYSQPGFEIAQYAYSNPARTLPTAASYSGAGVVYDLQTGAYVQANVHQYPGYAYMQNDMRFPTPTSQHGAQALGGYGLPGQPTSEDLFVNSRTATPSMQYAAPVVYPTYSEYAAFHQPPTPAQQQRYLYEHQQYLQAASQLQSTIDPSLDAALAAGAVGTESHFDEAIGDMTENVGFANLPEYFEESISPDQTLAPRWEPTVAEFHGQ